MGFTTERDLHYLIGRFYEGLRHSLAQIWPLMKNKIFCEYEVKTTKMKILAVTEDLIQFFFDTLFHKNAKNAKLGF